MDSGAAAMREWGEDLDHRIAQAKARRLVSTGDLLDAGISGVHSCDCKQSCQMEGSRQWDGS